MRIIYSCFAMLLLAGAGGCQNRQAMKESSENNAAPLSFAPGPPALVYKTKADYTNKVAVMMNADRTAIVSYPHPRDIALPQGLPYPIRLNKGYLLDRQGVGPQVAFTRYTMEEYAALPEAPDMQVLLASIIDKDPLLEMCHCGNSKQFEDVQAAMNALIDRSLAPCKKLMP